MNCRIQNEQKSVAFLYSNNEWSEQKIKETIWFYNKIKRNKIFRNKLNQGVKDLCTENYKILLKEIKDDMSKYKETHVHEPGDLILLKCQYHPKWPTYLM